MEPLDSNNLRRDLSAFADGELDSAETDRLLPRLAADPAAVLALRRLQQLSVAARRTIREHTPAPSAALREKLQQLIDNPIPIDAPIPPESPARPDPLRTTRLLWAILPRAAAAVILVACGMWIGRHLALLAVTPTTPDPITTTADVIPAAVVAQAEEVHGFCSRLAQGLHSAGYPADVAPLASSVEQDLHSDHPYPNLLPIGYRYRGAGPCGEPLGGMVHLLYRSVRPGSVKAVSVFVQTWHNQYPVEPGRFYTVSVASSPFPMLAWRTDRVLYFLLADDAQTEKAAAALIGGAPASHPASTANAPKTEGK